MKFIEIKYSDSTVMFLFILVLFIVKKILFALSLYLPEVQGKHMNSKLNKQYSEFQKSNLQ